MSKSRQQKSGLQLNVSAAAHQVVFEFASNASYWSERDRMIPLPVEIVNPGRRYSNSMFITTLEGIHFVEACIGVRTSSRSSVRKN